MLLNDYLNYIILHDFSDLQDQSIIFLKCLNDHQQLYLRTIVKVM